MSSQQPLGVVTPAELYHQLIGNQQLALIDVREIRPYSQGHLLFAIPLPLARLELMVADLIPCRAAAIVICDGGSADADNLHLGMRAARRLAELSRVVGDGDQLAGVRHGAAGVGRRRRRAW